jgi:hypothetical protein
MSSLDFKKRPECLCCRRSRSDQAAWLELLFELRFVLRGSKLEADVIVPEPVTDVQTHEVVLSLSTQVRADYTVTLGGIDAPTC